MSDEARLGREVKNWTPPPRPADDAMEGRVVRLEPLNADAHAADLHRAFAGHESLWDYMPYGPFVSAGAYHRWAKEREAAEDPRFFVLRNRATGHCGGIASYLRIAPEAGSIEVGHICISPEMQKGLAATEAMWLMMDWAFRAGYRRYEWKCNALNMASRRAAQRLGFSYEGIFRNHLVVKGRNRDTAWFSITDGEWPQRAEGFERWLAPENFDAQGRQKASLTDCMTQAGAA